MEAPPRIQELKHTSTFLQKPQRPPPPSKSDLEKQASDEGEQYRVVIKKQQKKSVTERLLEKGLLEPIEDHTPEPPIEVNAYTPGCNHRHDDNTPSTILPPAPEIKILQVIPRVREINIVQHISRKTDENSQSPAKSNDDTSQVSAPNMKDLLKLLDSVQSLEALLLRKCAEQKDDPIESCSSFIEPCPSSSNSIPMENHDNDDDGDTCTINYTPWCNAFKTEVQLEVPSNEVFAEFTVNVAVNSENSSNIPEIPNECSMSKSEEINYKNSTVDLENLKETSKEFDNEDNYNRRTIKDLSMPNLRKHRRSMRNRLLKSCVAGKKVTIERKCSVSPSRRLKLRRRGRYLENYLSKNMKSWWKSFNRFVRSKKVKGSAARRLPKRNRSYFIRAINKNFDIVKSGKNYLSSVIFEREDDINLRKSSSRSLTIKRGIREKGRYAEKISRVVCCFAKRLVTVSENESLNSMTSSKQSRPVFDTVFDIVRSTGCFVSDKIFHRGRKKGLSRKWRNINIDSYSPGIKNNSRLVDSVSSLNSVTSGISQESTGDCFVDEDECFDYRINDFDDLDDRIDDGNDREIDEGLEEKRRPSLVSDILYSCLYNDSGRNFATLAACALVPFTSIILLYLYK